MGHKKVTVIDRPKRELSDVIIGEEFDLETLLGGIDMSSNAKQKERARDRLFQLKQLIMAKQFAVLEKQDTLKKAEAKLKQTEVYKAIAGLRKDIKMGNKSVDSLMKIFLGGASMLKAVGITLDKDFVKAIAAELNNGRG